MRVVMLSGPIGAGKTTVARELLSLVTTLLVTSRATGSGAYLSRPR